MPASSDVERALALLERVQRKVGGNEGGRNISTQVNRDLEMLMHLLQNPVLKNIISIQDSLENLHNHVAHHPSLLPTDFDIDLTGHLVLNTNILHTPEQSETNKLVEGKVSPVLSKSSMTAKSVSPVQPEKGSLKESAVFQQALQQAAALREIISIQLNKPEGQSLGFSVVGLRSDQKGDLGIFIQEIQPTGIAGRDGRLREGDQILAIDGQVLEAAISHQAAIGILQRARGIVDLVVARGLNPLADVPVPLIPALASSQHPSVAAPAITVAQQKHSPDSARSSHRSSNHSQSGDPTPSPSPEPSAAAAAEGGSHLPTVTSALAVTSIGRSPSALSDASKTGSDMVLNTEWAQVEVVDLVNDGSGLGFGIIGGRSTGVVVKTIVPGGVADRDGRLQSGDHILQIGEVSLRGMGSEQVAAVLRQSGTQVRLIVARPIEPTSPDYQGMSSTAPIVPTKVLGDPEELEKHLTMLQNGFGADSYAVAAAAAVEVDQNADANGILNINVGAGVAVDGVAPVVLKEYGNRFIFAPQTVELERSEVQLHAPVASNAVDLNPAAVLHLAGTHLTASTTEPVSSASPLDFSQTVDLNPDITLDFLPEVETFDVELKKDSQGLGITIAGYVCEREELSGIFVKSINPGSVADFCGQIQINDQIVEVDGQSLRGFNNHQAVEVLRSTGQVVRLRLARYLHGPKYDELQQAMADSVPAPPAPLVPAALVQSNSAEMATTVRPVSPSETIPKFAERVNLEENGDSDSDDNLPTPQVPEPAHQSDLKLITLGNEVVRDATDSMQLQLNYSSMTSEELDKYIDSDYTATISPQCEAAVIAKWRSLVDSDVDIVVAQLSKFQPTGGLGISLEGTVDVEEGREVRPHHYIRSILPNGPVGQNGILRSGDELLEVNGRKLLGLSHVEVVSILKELPQWVRMVCARRQTLPPLPSRPIDPTQDRAAFAARNILGGSLQSLIPPSDRLVKAKSDGSLASTSISAAADSPLSKSYRSRSLEPLSGLATWSSEPQVIELVKGDRGLGFSILDYQDPMNPNETIIVIRSLVPGGVAQQDGRLIPGDRLLFVNDINLENAALDEAVQALKGAPKGIVRIGVAKPHPVALSDGNTVELQHEDDAEYNSDAGDNRSESSSSQDEGNDSGECLSDAPQVKVPPPLPQTEPPTLDSDSPETDSVEYELPNPLLVPVATERLLGSSISGSESAAASPPDVPPLPSALEQTIRIKKGSDPLGINVEVIDGGVNGVVITSINRGGAVHRDGRLRVGDCLVSVNHETMRFCTNAQARAILRRTQLVSTDISIVYVPANDAAIHRQTALMQLAQEVDVNTTLSKSSSTVTRTFPQYYRIPNLTRSVDAHVPGKAEETLVVFRIEEPKHLNDLTVTSTLPLSPETPSAPAEIPSVHNRALDSKEAPEIESIVSAAVKEDENIDIAKRTSSSTTTTNLQVPGSTSATGKGAGVGSTSLSSGMNTNSSSMARHWGPERSVKIVRDPTKSLGISIVGGKVDVSAGSGSPISGIFIKNVLPDSPAGRTGQLRTGDRILEVDGENLRSASHEKAVEVIRKAGNPVTFLVQSLVDWEQEPTANSNSLAPSALSKYSTRDGVSSPVTDAEHMTPIPNGGTTPLPGSEDGALGLPKVVPEPATPARSPTPEVIQSGGTKKPPLRKQVESSSSDDEDSGDLQGKTTTAKGVEIDRASAGYCKLTAAEKQQETEEPDDFGYTTKKIQKRWGDLPGEVVRVDLDRSGSTISSLGLSLAGHKDRQIMAVFICGLNPNGIAFKDGRLRVGDELLEVNGNVIHGRCHLNASAVIKSLAGPRITIVALRREGALQDVAVPPITRFPITLEEQPPEERYARFKNLRIISLKKGSQGLGIMIIEGRHSEVGNGIFISDIQEGSVAEQAGLTVGDMILCVNKDELLGADYDTAASVLKKSEGLLNIVVCNPGKSGGDKQPTVSKKEEKPKVPPKPIIAPKPSVAARLPGAKSASSSSLPPTYLDSHSSNPSLLSQSAPQSPLNNQPVGPRSDSREQDPSGLPSCSETITSFGEPGATPVDVPKSGTHASSLAPAAANALGPSVLKGTNPTVPPPVQAPPTQQTKAVLRQHVGGGPGSISKNSAIIKAADEPPPDPATCEVKPGKETTIEVNKDKLGLGLSIVGGSDTLLGAILIHEVYPDGAAARDGRLKPGDQILEVNGESFRNITHSRALAVLRQTPAKVKMMVYRDETSSKDDDMLDIIEVELLKKPGRGLGLSIVGRRNGPGVYISDVVKGGAAEADGRLMQGDQILTVNGNDLRTASQEQAAAILKTAMGKIDLKVGRLKAGAASPRSATSAESPAPSNPPPPIPPVREDSLPVGDSAADSPPPPSDVSGTGPTYTKVYLERGADGLGFSIVGGRGNPQGDLPIFVKSVFDRGAAAQSGLLRPGDQIYAVDDVLLEGKTHQEAVALLKNAKGTVILTIVS